MGNSNGWAESRRYSLDLKPDSDNANVGKYMSEMIGFCVRAPCFLCELGAPLFTDADRRRMIQILYRPVFFVSWRNFFESQVSWKGELGYGKDQRRRKTAWRKKSSLLLVDFYVVDVTNLNRQMYFVSQLGKPKAEALPEVLYRINPYLVCESRCEKVTPENVRELFEDYPIVCWIILI